MPLTTPSISSMTSKALWLAAIMTLPFALFLIISNKTILMNWEFLSINSSSLSFLLMFDPKGMIFSFIVLFISANVLQFSNCYMQTEKFISRFTYLVLMFILSMNLLIYIPHLIALLLGWDGLGIISFLLVAYYQNPKALGASMITALSNRIGDVLILLSIGWTMNQGHWNLLNMSSSPYSNAIIMSIMLAGMTKSAQMPFSSWLPAAMAAPTPVSALVHSSTLVTAGVFLLIRFYPFLHSFIMFNKLILLISTTTMLMAGLAAMSECDLKKIIALSTLSQLGMMMAAIGMNLPALAFFHLITHALFKALLFICAGSLIHYHHHTQDLRQMGNILHQMPLTTATMLTANLALCGFPFLAGFYSKDLILEISLFSPENYIIIIMFFMGTLLTSAYSVRMMLIAIWAPANSQPLHNLNNANNDLSLPVLFLALGAIIGGASMNWILIYPTMEPVLSPILKFTTLASVLLGLTYSWSAFNLAPMKYPSKLTKFSLPLFYSHLSSAMWFLTPTSSQKTLIIPSPLSHMFLKSADQGWVELLGGKGAFILTSFISTNLQHLQFNIFPRHLLLSMFITLPLLLMIF